MVDLSPEAVRQKVAQMRDNARQMADAADKLEQHLVGMLALMDSGAYPWADGAVEAAPAPAPERRKGKQPGAISAAWKERLGVLSVLFAQRTFSIEDAMRGLSGHVTMAPSQIERQFEPYVAAGYMARPAKGRYSFTDQGIEKVRLGQNENGEAKASPDARDRAATPSLLTYAQDLNEAFSRAVEP